MGDGLRTLPQRGSVIKFLWWPKRIALAHGEQPAWVRGRQPSGIGAGVVLSLFLEMTSRTGKRTQLWPNRGEPRT